jgi:hypothetical protein
MKALHFLLPLFLVLLFQSIDAQTVEKPKTLTQAGDSLLYEGRIVKIVMVNKLERIGEIIADDGREILLKTNSLGYIYIPKNDIISITPLRVDSTLEVYDDYIREIGSYNTRYYFTTNALPLQKNEDYAMLHVYGPEIHFSMSKRLSLGIMTTWIASPFVFAAKYSIPTKNKNVNFGFGTLLGSSGYLLQFRGYGGVHWGMLTLGNRMRNINISAGIAYLSMGTSDELIIPGRYFRENWGSINYAYISQKDPMLVNGILSIAGKTRIGKKSSFIFDSMLFFAKNDKVYENREEVDNVTPAYVDITHINYQQRITTIVLMPGIRWQTTSQNAFQLSLAGVVQHRDKVYNYDGSYEAETFSIPVPMFTWMIQF